MQLFPSLFESSLKWLSREAEVYAQIGRGAMGLAADRGFQVALRQFVIDTGFEALDSRFFGEFYHFGDLSARLDKMHEEAKELWKLDDGRYSAIVCGTGISRFWEPLALTVSADRPVQHALIADDLCTAFKRTYAGLSSVHHRTHARIVGYRLDQPFPTAVLFTYAEENPRSVRFSPHHESAAGLGLSHQDLAEFFAQYVGRMERGNLYFPKY